MLNLEKLIRSRKLSKFLVLPLYPLFFAIYPVLFLFSSNIKETTFDQVYMFLLVSIVMTTILWAVIFILVKDLSKSALMVLILLIAFFSYGRVFDMLKNFSFPLTKHIYLVAIYLLIFGYLCYFSTFVKNPETKINIILILNIVASVLVIINVVTIVIFYSLNTPQKSGIITNENVHNSFTKEKPDIYLIIPDEYASVNTMKEVYDYDNTEFTNYLESIGFYIANGVSKYIGTSNSIPSILNMNYIEEGSSSMSESNVQKYLESIGYSTTWFGTEAYYDGIWKIKTNKYYNFYHNTYNDFEKVYISTTLLRPYYDYNLNKQYFDVYRTSLNKTLSAFTSEIDEPGPKLVILHLLAPHQPFIFDENGKEVDFEHRFNWNDKKYYRNQYIFTTKILTDMVKNINKSSNSKSIILIQSDHGPRGGITENDIKTNGEVVPEKYRHEVFQAYYLPNNGDSVMYKDISPVNLFRVVFDFYFNTDFGKLEDYKFK